MGSVDCCDPLSNSNCSHLSFLFSSLFVVFQFQSTLKMKCFVSVLGLIGAAAAAPQFIADTPEVQEAKIAFAKAFNKAAKGSAIALEQAGVQDTDPNDPNYSPPAVPYVHVDIPAEPYVHDEPDYVAGSDDEPAQPAAAPVAAPVPQFQAPVAPVAPVTPAPFQAPVQAPVPVQNRFNVPAQNPTFAPFNFNPQQQQQQFAFNPQQVFAPQQLAFNGQPQQFAFNPQAQQQFAFNPQQQQFPFNPQQQQFAFNPQAQQQFAFNPVAQQQLAFNPQVPEQARSAAATTGCFNHKGAAVPCFS